MSLHLENLPRTVEMLPPNAASADVMTFRFVDQRSLPSELVRVETSSWRVVRRAICELAVRGAPAIGVAGAAAAALAAGELARVLSEPSFDVRTYDSRSPFSAEALADDAYDEAVSLLASSVRDGDGAAAVAAYRQAFAHAVESIIAARPTAVNLEWAVRRAAALAQDVATSRDAMQLPEKLRAFAVKLERDDEAANRAIGANGAALLEPESCVLTHCNAGSLATAFFGTALGVVYAAAAQGKIKRVFADETRPVGQGARLTAWELAQAGVSCTLICDNMAASVMSAGMIDAVVVGADRIAANGDTANKIGTYGVAVLARYHDIPFYVAAPASTIDMACQDGSGIPIEQRSASEVAPDAIAGVDVLNPAFDVTPASLITGIITERGVFAPGELREAFRQDS